MSIDTLRDLQKFGRHLNGLDPEDIGIKSISPRTCFIVTAPRSMLDSSAYLDAIEAAKMFTQADFKMFFLTFPEYTDFYHWYTFFLKNVYEYLAVVFTGFPMKSPDGGPGVGAPFVIKDREVSPTKIFKHVKKYKHPSSRLTFVINGCPATESWSNGGESVDKLSFSTTSLSFKKPMVSSFKNEVPERVLLITAAPRLDVTVSDRAKSGSGHFITELAKLVQNDPVLTAVEIFDKLTPKLRPLGEECVLYTSSFDVESETPFLL